MKRKCKVGWEAIVQIPIFLQRSRSLNEKEGGIIIDEYPPAYPEDPPRFLIQLPCGITLEVSKDQIIKLKRR